MTEQESPKSGHSLDEFLGEPTKDLNAWRWLWERDEEFPVRSHRGLLGSVVVFLKRLIRPWVKLPQNDLWERQRVFNLVLLEALQQLQLLEPVLTEADQLCWNAQEYKDLSVFLSRFFREGVADVVSHNDALYSRVDQKLDRYRRETRRLWATLDGALSSPALSSPEGEGAAAVLARVRADAAEPELDAYAGGRGAERPARAAAYLDHLPPPGTVLDLGCGEGETLEALRDAGYAVRGADPSATNVEICRQKGFEVVEGDLLEAIERQAEASLSAIVSLHRLERLSPSSIVRLVRLAWRALEPGGRLILETPNPLSLVVAARNFWLDPRRRRPVHPDHLEAVLRNAGFEGLRRLELRAFDDGERLPEISLEGLDGDARQLADQVNRLRDQLDALMFGHQDYGLVAIKPAG